MYLTNIKGNRNANIRRMRIQHQGKSKVYNNITISSIAVYSDVLGEIHCSEPTLDFDSLLSFSMCAHTLPAFLQSDLGESYNNVFHFT